MSARRHAPAPGGTRETGRRAEDLAARYLTGRGLEEVERNVSCRAGEIDLVMRDGDTLVFVEVRYRRSDRFGSAAETIGAAKRRRLVLAAQHYLQTRRSTAPARFDVVAIGPGDPAARIEWIADAFGA